MKRIIRILLFHSIALSVIAQPPAYKNIWTEAPKKIPNNVSVDAPLMGNGDLTMSVGYKENSLYYYLSKNDFWRLRSKANLSGPRVVGVVELKTEGFNDGYFSAEQLLRNGNTTCTLHRGNSKIEIRSWVSAIENLIILEMTTLNIAAEVLIKLSAPENKMALLLTGEKNDIQWLTRSFTDSVDISTEAAVALKVINNEGNPVVLKPGKKTIIAIAVESRFKKNDPLKYVVKKVNTLKEASVHSYLESHDKWWNTYWGKSSIFVDDTVLMKAYYQGLYTMAACSRDKLFPPGIFGWTTTDTPGWNGDYHLNYNFQAPFYSLYSANRLEQAVPHDAPLLDFMPRGEWYAENVTGTRGILYPVGIGPLGIEVTRNYSRYSESGNEEKGGLFFGQRSNAAYGLVNMAQYWRCTYNKKYGEKIYPYALAVVNFWEDYLKFEDNRYVIYADAIHEGSGKDKNSILSLGLIRNSFDLVIDLSTVLQKDEERQRKWRDILDNISGFPVQTRNGRTVFRYSEEGVAWWNDNGLGIQHIYPANAITLDSKPELLEISRNTINEMKRWQDFNTSNSFFVAAIRIGYDPSVIMDELHKYAVHTYPNGFQLNNPHGIENICTVTNALNEMLCMSAGDVIRLFSVFPANMNASFTDIRAWGAFLVSAKLKKGVVSDVKIVSEKGKPLTIVNPWPGRQVHVIRNNRRYESLSGERFTIKTSPKEVIELRPEY